VGWEEHRTRPPDLISACFPEAQPSLCATVGHHVVEEMVVPVAEHCSYVSGHGYPSYITSARDERRRTRGHIAAGCARSFSLVDCLSRLIALECAKILWHAAQR